MIDTIYKNNLEALKESRPALYKRILAVEDKSSIEVLTSKCGIFTLRVEGVFFHSVYNPIKEVDYLIEDLDIENIYNLVVLGFGLGYHIKRIWSERNFKGRMLIVEKEPAIFKKALETIDFSQLLKDKGVYIILEENASLVTRIIENSNFFRVNDMAGVDTILHPPSVQTYLEYYLEILKSIRNCMSWQQMSLGTLNTFKNIWQENSLDNLFDVVNSLGLIDLKGLFRNIPAIIVSAGPSLNNDIDVLKRAKGRIPIFCVGTALKVLLNAGIEPDFVVVVDAHPKVLKQFEGISAPKSSYLVAVDFVRKEIVDMFRPRYFFYSCDNPFSLFIPEGQRKGRVFSGGSVAHACIDIAVQMGFNPIILVGQDLSFFDGRTHAQGTMYDGVSLSFSDEESFKKQGLMWVKGNYEEKVLTNQVFFIFLENMKRYIKNRPNVEFINATSKGAFIEGTKLISLEEVLKDYNQASFSEMVKEVIRSKIDSFKPDIEAFKNNLEESLSQIRLLRDNLQEGYEKAKRLKELISSASDNREEIRQLALDLEDLGSKIDNNPFSSCLIYGSGYYLYLLLDISSKFSRIEVEAQKKVTESAYEVYKGFLDSAEFILERLEGILLSVRKSNYTR
ncbi:MAG: DUF115 domain-containing protein [Candidatus Omnitrophica bacterium]|nr:DUF115 domain-containing protein [Candidatus Omnitrophota bacterium]